MAIILLTNRRRIAILLLGDPIMNKTIILICVVIIILLLLFFISKVFAKGTSETSSAVGEKKASYRKISAQEAKEMIDSESLIILDVRTPGEFAGAHIKDAINIANEAIGSDRPTSLPQSDATILVYCRSGSRSAQASKKLLALGYTEVYDFGGIINWPYETVQ